MLAGSVFGLKWSGYVVVEVLPVDGYWCIVVVALVMLGGLSLQPLVSRSCLERYLLHAIDQRNIPPHHRHAIVFCLAEAPRRTGNLRRYCVCAPRARALAFASKVGYEWQGRPGKTMAFTHH